MPLGVKRDRRFPNGPLNAKAFVDIKPLPRLNLSEGSIRYLLLLRSNLRLPNLSRLPLRLPNLRSPLSSRFALSLTLRPHPLRQNRSTEVLN